MILLVDLCYKKGSLSRYEFVLPIANILKRIKASYNIVHHTELCDGLLEKSEKIILCGTAIKDNAYCEKINLFSWLKGCDKPVLGICAGMQVIGLAFGGEIVPQPSIGLEKIDIVRSTSLLGEARQIDGYHLHNFGVTLPDGFELVAGSPQRVEAFLHFQRPIYGTIFHPEVRNRWIVERFTNFSAI
jgi:GMP synthase-like glutamine amidotransferase